MSWIRQAAQGELLHNDDTTVKILELRWGNAAGKRCALADAEWGRQRQPPGPVQRPSG